MLIRSATILCLFAAVATTVARCATIKQREIPVEVRYEDKTKGENSIRNLDEKIQLSPEEEKQSLKLEEAKTEEPASPNNLDANLPQKEQVDNAFQENPLEEPKQPQQQLLEEKQQPEKKLEEAQPPQQLEEKPQQQQQQQEEEKEPLLPSSEKPAQQEPTLQPESHPLRHLPVDVDEPKQPKEEKPVDVKKLEDQPQPENPPKKEAEPSPQPPLQEEPKPTQQPQEEKPQDAPTSKSLTEEPKAQDSNLESILQQAQAIVSDGLKQLRDGFKPEKGDQTPKPEQWENLEKSINQFFEEEKSKIQTKQEQPQQNQNIFQAIASGVQSATSNFIQSLQSGAPQGQGDEGAAGGEQPANQGGFQAFFAAFQGGVNNMLSSINNLGGQSASTSNTVLGDEGGASSPATPTGGPAGLLSTFVSNVQQFIGNLPPSGGQAAAQPGAIAQGDTGTAPANNQNTQQGPIQAIQQFGTAFGNFIQGKPPQGSSGDVGTGSTQAPNLFQNIGNAVQNFIQYKPPNQGGGAQNPVQTGIQNVQNQLNPSSEAPAATAEKQQEPEQPKPEQAEQKQPEQQPEKKGETGA